MKKIWLALLISTSTFAQKATPPHLDLEMTSAEYESLLKQNNDKSLKSDPQIENVIALGQRLSKWIAKINEGRTPTTAIRLTSAGTRTGIPIDKSSIYSPKIIREKLVTVARDLPEEMRKVVFGKDELPGTTSLDDETFIKHARLLDKNYQQAARYKSVDQYRDYYTYAATKDVRGYYYITKNKIGLEELKDVERIPANQLGEIKEALRGLCRNFYADSLNCVTLVDTAVKENKLGDIYKATMPMARKIWDEFFVIPSMAIRQDVQWTASSMIVPFNTPTVERFIPYLRDNIQDEFKWNNWGLNLNFGAFVDGPRLQFQSGVVPHVDRLGGNNIVMDSNQPIEEYESQWTIRHEFGHVVGLPDCYHEFYDQNLNAYVNYQLDTTDLMCSRAGNMNERIYLEFKRVYLK